jgi:hypothetical protein
MAPNYYLLFPHKLLFESVLKTFDLQAIKVSESSKTTIIGKIIYTMNLNNY